ncbi:hypothetical protein KAURM247S_06216 [Kitasatospora aureofaciens]
MPRVSQRAVRLREAGIGVAQAVEGGDPANERGDRLSGEQRNTEDPGPGRLHLPSHFLDAFGRRPGRHALIKSRCSTHDEPRRLARPGIAAVGYGGRVATAPPRFRSPRGRAIQAWGCAPAVNNSTAGRRPRPRQTRTRLPRCSRPACHTEICRPPRRRLQRRIEHPSPRSAPRMPGGLAAAAGSPAGGRLFLEYFEDLDRGGHHDVRTVDVRAGPPGAPVHPPSGEAPLDHHLLFPQSEDPPAPWMHRSDIDFLQEAHPRQRPPVPFRNRHARYNDRHRRSVHKHPVPSSPGTASGVGPVRPEDSRALR